MFLISFFFAYRVDLIVDFYESFYAVIAYMICLLCSLIGAPFCIIAFLWFAGEKSLETKREKCTIASLQRNIKTPRVRYLEKQLVDYEEDKIFSLQVWIWFALLSIALWAYFSGSCDPDSAFGLLIEIFGQVGKIAIIPSLFAAIASVIALPDNMKKHKKTLEEYEQILIEQDMQNAATTEIGMD